MRRALGYLFAYRLHFFAERLLLVRGSWYNEQADPTPTGGVAMGMGMMGQMMGDGMARGVDWMAGSTLIFLLMGFLFLGGGVLFFSWLQQERSATTQKIGPPPSRLEALKGRYIAGDISLEEFEKELTEALDRDQAQERWTVAARRRS